MQNTHLSDLNELACGYFLNKEVWWDSDAEGLFREKAAVVKSTGGKEAVTVQVERARAMGMRLRVHLAESQQSIQQVYWVARGSIQSVVPDASPNHPADVLLRLSGGFLGVSCKSRKGSEGSGLRNPGLSAVSLRYSESIYRHRSMKRFMKRFMNGPCRVPRRSARHFYGRIRRFAAKPWRWVNAIGNDPRYDCAKSTGGAGARFSG
jgi:hypothetical protein